MRVLILLATIVGDIPRSSPGSSILDMPRHEKPFSTFNYNMRVSNCLRFITREKFLIRRTAETFMVETAVCPMYI